MAPPQLGKTPMRGWETKDKREHVHSKKEKIFKYWNLCLGGGFWILGRVPADWIGIMKHCSDKNINRHLKCLVNRNRSIDRLSMDHGEQVYWWSHSRAAAIFAVGAPFLDTRRRQDPSLILALKEESKGAF